MFCLSHFDSFKIFIKTFSFKLLSCFNNFLQVISPIKSILADATKKIKEKIGVYHFNTLKLSKLKNKHKFTQSPLKTIIPPYKLTTHPLKVFQVVTLTHHHPRWAAHFFVWYKLHFTIIQQYQSWWLSSSLLCIL